MFDSFQTNENIGKLKISRDVIVTIVKQAACEVTGVHSLARIPMDVKTCVQHRGIPDEVAVDLTGDVAVLDLAIRLEGGHRLEEVVPKLQQTIKDAVQSMTGVVVSRVNVIVEGIAFPVAGEEEEAQ